MKTPQDKTSKDKSSDNSTVASEIIPGEIYLPNFPKKTQNYSISSFSLDKCRELIAPLADMIRENLVRISPKSPYAMRSLFSEMKTIGNFNKLKKDYLCQIYDSFEDELLNIVAIAKADKRYENAWKRIINNLTVPANALKSQLGREVKVVGDYGWYYRAAVEVLFAPCLIVDVQQRYSIDYRRYELYSVLSLTASTRKKLAEHIFGNDYVAPHLTAKIPDSKHLVVDNFESHIATDIMTLEGIALNGSILGSNGSISAAMVKRIRNQSNIQNFSASPEEWPTDRVEMVCLTYFTLLERMSKKNSIDVKNLAVFAVDDMPRMIKGPIFNTFMPAFQGFTKTWTSDSYVVHVAKIVKNQLLLTAYDWLSLDNFRMLLLCSGHIDEKNYYELNLFPLQWREKASIVRKIDKLHEDDKNWKVKPIEWFDEIGLKFALHWLKYLCALGIVEIAVASDVKDKDQDPLEGMRYVRLTPLGKYVFSLEKSYTPPKALGGSEVEYDAKNNIITLDAKSPYMMFLSKITKRISPTRLHISRESLIKGCTNKDNLEQRIKNLSVIIDPKKEPALKKIIDDALHHTDCAERDGGYSLLKLRPDLPELRQLLLTDKELNEMTIMATNSLVLVKTSQLERFYALCASHGYLMT